MACDSVQWFLPWLAAVCSDFYHGLIQGAVIFTMACDSVQWFFFHGLLQCAAIFFMACYDVQWFFTMTCDSVQWFLPWLVTVYSDFCHGLLQCAVIFTMACCRVQSFLPWLGIMDNHASSVVTNGLAVPVLMMERDLQRSMEMTSRWVILLHDFVSNDHCPESRRKHFVSVVVLSYYASTCAVHLQADPRMM